MNETELQSTPAPDEPAQVEPVESDRKTAGLDLGARPDAEWLGVVESELDDTDLVLKCLARDSAKMCETCDTAQAAGELGSRPMLERCARTKQPR